MRFRLLQLAVALSLFAVACTDPEIAKVRHLQKGDEHMAKGEVREAILEYRNALKADARYGEARYKLAEAFLKDNRPEQAAREYIRAGELLPDRVDVQIKAGTILLAAGEFQRAQQAGENALKADPKSLDAQLLIAHALAGLKDLPSAIREIEEAIQLAPEDSRPYTSLGTVRLAEGNRVKAGEAYKRAVELDPKSVSPRLSLAFFYWSGGVRDKTEEQLKAASAIDPAHVLANRSLALFYLTTDRPKEAEAPLSRLASSDDPSALMLVADHYVRTDRSAEARKLYERLKEQRYTRRTAIHRLATLDHAAGNREQAHAALDEEMKVDASGADLAILKTRFLLAEGKLQDADAMSAKAVEIDPASASAHYVRGLALMARQQTEAARKSFTETLRINPRAASAELQLSRLSLAAGDAAEALRLAESARKAEPANLEARLGVTQALLSRGDFRRAEAELNALRTDYPKAAPVHALFGRMLAARADVAGAAREFDRALAIDPADPQALEGRIAVDLHAKKPAQARERIARALHGKPDNVEVLVLAGRLEATAGDRAAAERHFRRAIEVNSAALNAYGLLGQLYMQEKRLEEARLEFEKLSSLNTGAIGPKTMVGLIYEMQNRPEDARKTYEAIVAGTERAPVAANNLAWHYAEAGENLDRALDLAQRAKQQLPNSHEVDDTLGWVYYKRNMAELAIAPFERAVKAAPETPEYHAHLGLAYAKAGRTDDARRALERALKLRADFPGATESRAVLASLPRQ